MADTAAATRYPLLEKEAGGWPIRFLSVEFTANEPTSRRGLKNFTLHPGVFNEDAFELFGYGFCHQLAAATRERSGWPLAAVRRPSVDCDCDYETHDNCVDWVHMGVRTPGGLFLDIRGPRRYDDVIRQYECEEIYLPGFAQAVAVGAVKDPWADPKLPAFAEVVRCFADALIENAEEA